jgi:hypothetical protein
MIGPDNALLFERLCSFPGWDVMVRDQFRAKTNVGGCCKPSGEYEPFGRLLNKANELVAKTLKEAEDL